MTKDPSKAPEHDLRRFARDLTEENDALKEALADLMERGMDDAFSHVPHCLRKGFCRCQHYRRLLHDVRGVECEYCDDLGVIGDPLGPDMGKWDVVGCPVCAPEDPDTILRREGLIE